MMKMSRVSLDHLGLRSTKQGSSDRPETVADKLGT
jgi:hypothetical protein